MRLDAVTRSTRTRRLLSGVSFDSARRAPGRSSRSMTPYTAHFMLSVPTRVPAKRRRWSFTRSSEKPLLLELMLTELQYNELEDRYGKLIYKIAHWISGDKATATIEDNVQDLWLVLFETINTFSRLNEEDYPGGYEDFKDTAHWNKYVKTALWNSKNSKGTKIAQRYNITRDTVSTWENSEVMEKEDYSFESVDFDMFLEDLPKLLNETELRAVRLLVEDPTLITEQGDTNRSALAREMGIAWAEADSTLKSIGAKLQNQL